MQITSTPASVHFGGIKKTLQASAMSLALLGPAGASQASEILQAQDDFEIQHSQAERLQVSHWQARQDQKLMEAALNGDEKGVKEALKNGANPDVKDADNTTVLMHVSLKGYDKIAKTLLKEGADPEAQNNFGFTSLMNASANCHAEIVNLLLEKYDVDPNVQNNNGLTALMFASASNCVEVVEALLEAGADPNIKNNYDRTAQEQTRDLEIKEILKIAEEEFQSDL